MVDLTGRRFGKLVVLRKGRSEPTANGTILYWLCLCDCKNEKEIAGGSLRHGYTKSCGCIVRKHGHRESRTYKSWSSMKARCLNSNAPDYFRYGGRGIEVCTRWLGTHGFEHFLEDMGERPEGKTLDRFPDKNGNYTKSNCRWATAEEQNNNTRTSRLTLKQRRRMRALVSEGKMRGKDIATLFGIPRAIVYVAVYKNKHRPSLAQ